MTTQYISVRGVTMTGGYMDDRGPTVLRLAPVNGRWYEWSADIGGADLRDGPESYYCLDIDGLIIVAGACAGYGFLPDGGEIERLAARGVRLPQES